MEKVFVWGIGSFYRNSLEKLKQYEVNGYIDNIAYKTCNVFNGKKIISSNEIERDMHVIIMSKNFVPMVYELIKKEVTDFEIGVYIFPESRQEQLLSMYGKFNVAGNKLVYKYRYQNRIREIDVEDTMSALYKELVAIDKLAEKIELLPNVPICRDFGISRGTPIDRVYIEKFINKNKDAIKGEVLEIAENTYTLKFGGKQVKKSCILHVKGWGENVIAGNLETGEGIKDNQYDAAIVTQTLMFIYDLSNVVRNIHRMLRPGGVALITVAGISQISRYDAENWGSYWNFQIEGLKRLFEDSFKRDKIQIESYGNVQTATALLYGMCAEELSQEIYEYNDLQYPVILGIKVEKEAE